MNIVLVAEASTKLQRLQNLGTFVPGRCKRPVRCVLHLLDKETSEISRIVDEIERLNVKRIMPCHCTGREAVEIFGKRFQDRLIPARVGIEL